MITKVIEITEQEDSNNKVMLKIIETKEYKDNRDPIMGMKGETDRHKIKGKEKITNHFSQKDLNQITKIKKKKYHKIIKNKQITT